MHIDHSVSKLNRLEIIGAISLAVVNANAVYASTPALLNTKSEVYKSASTSGGSYGSFNAKTEITFESLDKDWPMIRRSVNGKIYTGYVNTPASVTLKDNTSIYIINKSGTSLYSDSNLSNKIVDSLAEGTKLTLAQFKGGSNSTAYVKTSDGKIGFMNTSDLSSIYIPEGGGGDDDGGDGGDGGDSGQTEAEQKIAQMVALAKQQIGKPYVYGGGYTKDKNFDCSGLTYYLYYKILGIKIGNSAHKQGHSMTDKFVKIARYEDLKAGDIIAFDFSMKASGSSTLGQDGACDHVGFFIGDNKMIEASSGARQVREFDFYNKKNGEYYRTPSDVTRQGKGAFLWGLRYKGFSS